MNVADAIVLALAAGRISYSITMDTIFEPVRAIVFKHSPPESASNADGQPYRMIHDGVFTAKKPPRKAGWFGQLFECPYCMSFWVSFLLLAAYIMFGETVIHILYGFALWGAATLYARYV